MERQGQAVIDEREHHAVAAVVAVRVHNFPGTKFPPNVEAIICTEGRYRDPYQEAQRILFQRATLMPERADYLFTIVANQAANSIRSCNAITEDEPLVCEECKLVPATHDHMRNDQLMCKPCWIKLEGWIL